MHPKIGWNEKTFLGDVRLGKKKIKVGQIAKFTLSCHRFGGPCNVKGRRLGVQDL